MIYLSGVNLKLRFIRFRSLRFFAAQRVFVSLSMVILQKAV